MIVAVDTSVLVLMINPDARPPLDPGTSAPLSRVADRINLFLSSFAAGDTLLVPTPVLAELLVLAGDQGPGLFASLQTLAKVKLAAFDERAAIEIAMMTREAKAAGDKRSGSEQPWQKVKFDRQIIAIARVHGAARILADDAGLLSFAKLLAMDTLSSWELALPPSTEDLFTHAGLDEPSNPVGDFGTHEK